MTVQRPVVVSGWGRRTATACELVHLTGEEAAEAVRRRPARGIVARGLGRSYGDAAQNAGGTVVAVRPPPGVEPIAPDGTVRLPAGASLGEVMAAAVPRGWFVPVTPGTRHVTVGGAIAADIHGKNHHVDGSFGNHVTELHLLTADGRTRRLTPDGVPADRDLFWATVGGMGLTGIIVGAVVRLTPIESSLLVVESARVRSFDRLLSELRAADDAHRYSVAWIDLAARGRQAGRGIVSGGDHASLEELAPAQRRQPLAWVTPRTPTVPPHLPGGLLRPATVRAFNELWYRRPAATRARHLETMPAFFHPLDGLGHWNRLYGRAGLVQYQFVVPDEALDVIERALADLAAVRAPSFLAVLKRFGSSNPAPLSFPMPGWTLAVDLPGDVPGLAVALDRLDEAVLHAGGRVYLAKDARARPDRLRAMYRRLDEFLDTCRRVDPDGLFTSDLARRAGWR